MEVIPWKPGENALAPVLSKNIIGVSAAEAALIRKGVASIAGVKHSAVHGSRAGSTFKGASGPRPTSDIDILVIREMQKSPLSPDIIALEKHLSAALQKKVNVLEVTPKEYEGLWKGHLTEKPIE